MEEDGALPSSSITSRKPFVYQPLDDTPNSFRLLEILPEKADGRIQLRIRHDKMPTTYKCLSYMWGDATESHEVLMNGSTSPIRKNLHDFLEMARVRFPNEKLWIDALCINQSDNAERGHQIQRMGDIYRGASEVLAWLGNTYA
ncbi:HET-domain-containing protein, partial [Trematosphaeria pertusa]